MAPLTPRLWRAYRLSVYEASGLSVRIGQRSEGEWPLSPRSFAILGACNPGGSRRSDRFNMRMMQALDAYLAGVPCCPARGGLGRWWEPMTAAAVPIDRARHLARLFGQNAFVWVCEGRASRLVVT